MTIEDPITRALGYPYPIPGTSFVVTDGVSADLHAAAAAAFRDMRTPVLAVGSNQSPMQIARKFQGPGWGPLPAEKCQLADFDTVYSAHVTGYGSIAAALHPSPGTRVSLFINWLDDAQLERMHETELGNENYHYARLDGLRIETEHGHRMESVFFYCSNAGAYAPNGDPIPLAEVAAQGRQWSALDQRGIQEHLHGEEQITVPLDDHIRASVADKELRLKRRQLMEDVALPFNYEAVAKMDPKSSLG